MHPCSVVKATLPCSPLPSPTLASVGWSSFQPPGGPAQASLSSQEKMPLERLRTVEGILPPALGNQNRM